ncbi:SH3 domain-containing protein [Streptomyces sp. NRRL S-1022]|uniref:SH3 domain-containing protein n=1 Tax=Streptomyces sp. NRRL S-1022 TaxID=1463880 RepID=UPI0004C23512
MKRLILVAVAVAVAVAVVLSGTVVAVPQASASPLEQPPTTLARADFSECGYEVIDTVRLRTGPGTRYTALGLLHRGDAVYASQTRGGWYRVRLAYDSGSVRHPQVVRAARGHHGMGGQASAEAERVHTVRLTQTPGRTGGVPPCTRTPDVGA